MYAAHKSFRPTRHHCLEDPIRAISKILCAISFICKCHQCVYVIGLGVKAARFYFARAAFNKLPNAVIFSPTTRIRERALNGKERQ